MNDTFRKTATAAMVLILAACEDNSTEDLDFQNKRELEYQKRSDREYFPLEAIRGIEGSLSKVLKPTCKYNDDIPTLGIFAPPELSFNHPHRVVAAIVSESDTYWEVETKIVNSAGELVSAEGGYAISYALCHPDSLASVNPMLYLILRHSE